MIGPSTAVVWDLDSTVADSRHRHHLRPSQPENRGNPEFTWTRYSLACSGDAPMAGSVALMRLLWPYHVQIAVSGRSQEAQELTEEWAATHDVPLDRIILRGTGNYTPNGLLKVQRIGDIQQQLRVVMAMEDWAGDAQEIRAAFPKIPVLVVNPEYDFCTCVGSSGPV